MIALLLMVMAQTAAPDRLHVEWVAPESCPDHDTLTSTLESSVPKNRSFWAVVRIDEPTRDDRAWRAVVVTRAAGQQSTRVIDGPDCERVTEAAMLVLTLAATNLPEEPTGQSTPAVLPEPALEPIALEKPPPDVPPRRWKFGLRLQPVLGANAGVLPVPSLSVGIALAFMRGPVRLELSAAQWLEMRTPNETRGANVSLISVKAKGCWVFELRATARLGPCASVEGGPLTATPLGVARGQRAVAPWVSALLGVTAGFDVAELVQPWVSLEVGINVVRPAFTISTPTGDVVAFQVGWPGGRIAAGVEFIFP